MKRKKKNLLLIMIMLLTVSTLTISCEKNESDYGSGNINSKISDITGLNSVEYDWEFQFKPDLEIVDIEGLDENHIWALGTDYDQGISCIYFYDGATWCPQIRTTFYLSKLYLLDETHMWLTGLPEDKWQWIIYFYDGETITEQYRFVPILDDTAVFDIAILDSNHVWATYSCHNDYGSIHFFDGVSWRLQYETGPIRFLHAFDPNNVWAAGARGLHFFDGQSWSLKIPLSSMIYSFYASDENNIWAANYIMCQYEGDDKEIKKFEGFDSEGYITISQIDEEEKGEAESYGVSFQSIWSIDTNHVWVNAKGWPTGAFCFFNGISWVELFKIDKDEVIRGYCYTDSSHVWAIDSKKEYRGGGEPKYYGSILFYDGNNWVRTLNLDIGINAILVVNDGYILVASEEGIYLSHMQLQE